MTVEKVVIRLFRRGSFSRCFYHVTVKERRIHAAAAISNMRPLSVMLFRNSRPCPYYSRSWLRKNIPSESPHRTKFSTRATRIHSWDDIEKWANTVENRKRPTAEEDFSEILVWLEKHEQLIRPNLETLCLLLEGALSLKERTADPIVETLLERLLNAIVSTETTSDSSLRMPIKSYMHKVMRRFINDAGQPLAAQDWLNHWWAYHEKAPELILPPTSETYAMIMSAWGKHGEPLKSLHLLKDIHDRENIRPEIVHFETCLNAFVSAAKKRHRRQAGYDAENTLLQMTDLFEKNRVDLTRSSSVAVAQYSCQTRALKNLNKVVVCWIESRSAEAAARITSILGLMDELFLESERTQSDCIFLAEAYSHAIRAWSFVATDKSNSVRRVLSGISVEYRDPTQQAAALLYRLEQLLDRIHSGTLPTMISPKIWRRIYGSAISSCGSKYNKGDSKGKLELALNLWRRFNERKCGARDTALYNHIFHVCGKLGEREVSSLLWGEMTSDASVRPDLKTFNWRLLAYKNSMKWPVDENSIAPVDQIWLEMKEMEVWPDTVSYNTFISCHIGTEDVSIAQRATSSFREMLSQGRDASCQPTVVTLNAVLRMWSIIARKSNVNYDRLRSLQLVVSILRDVQDHCSENGIHIQTNKQTSESVAAILEANCVAKDYYSSVSGLLEKIAGKRQNS